MDCSSVRSRDTIARVDIRTAATCWPDAHFVTGFEAGWRTLYLGPRASKTGADIHIRPITEACGRADRSERSKSVSN